MVERYTPLSPDDRIFRTARHGGGHLPAGHRLPKPEWLEPSREDIDEGIASGRAAGLSVWKTPPGDHRHACQHRGVAPETQRSFVIGVGALRGVAGEHERAVDVVTDGVPFDAENPCHVAVPEAHRAAFTAALSSHSLVEGLRNDRPSEKPRHRAFLLALVETFRELPSAPAP